MSTSPLPSRRTVLLAGTVGGVGVAVLGACSSAAKGTAAGGSTTVSPAGGTAAPPPAATPSAPATGAGGVGTSGTAAPASGMAKLTDIPIGQAVAVTLPGGTSAVVARPTATTAAAFDATCTHQGCTVAPRGKELHCPCHGSIYNAVTGAVILSANGGSNPGQAPLAKIAVHVKDGEVLAGAS